MSMLTTIDNANDRLQVNRKTKTAGVWSTKMVLRPPVFNNYNKYMNVVDRSDQILATNNVLRKCMKWWKTLFIHLIDNAVVNSFILFREHQVEFPDNEALRRSAKYSLTDFREELVRQLCGFPKYDVPSAYASVKPAPPPDQFETVHVPVFTIARRRCVVCYKKTGADCKVSSYCSAPQCEGKYMHVTTEKSCFKEFHTREYHSS